MRRLEVALPADTRAPALAREALASLLDLPPSLLDDARLLVSEVVTNAVCHAGLGPQEEVVLTAHATTYRLRLEVADRGPGFAPPPPAPPPPADASGGRGILLVRRLASRWGADHDGRQSVVWLELRRRARLSSAGALGAPVVSRRADRRPAVATSAPPA